MGPGIAIKAALRSRFSLMVFGWSQILMDIQPLVVMLTGEGDLHGLSHTLPGALVIGIAAALSGKPLGELGLRILREPQYLPIRWPVAWGSAFIGTFSHVLIDSIMHFDMAPLWPFSAASPLQSVISLDALHINCLASAVIGGVLFYCFGRVKKS